MNGEKPQTNNRANSVIVVVDIVAVVVDGTIVIDVRSVVAIVAGRPGPPPVRSNPRDYSLTAVIFFCRN